MTSDNGMTADTPDKEKALDRGTLRQSLYALCALEETETIGDKEIESLLRIFTGMAFKKSCREEAMRLAQKIQLEFGPLSSVFPPASQCTAKHTKYQPDMTGNLEWQCPKCAATAYDAKPFTIYQSAENADEECGLLHVHDVCICENCGLLAQGNAVARSLAKKHNMVTCPRCSGKGVVKKHETYF